MAHSYLFTNTLYHSGLRIKARVIRASSPMCGCACDVLVMCWCCSAPHCLGCIIRPLLSTAIHQGLAVLSEQPPKDQRDRNERESGYTKGQRGELTLTKDIPCTSPGNKTLSKPATSILKPSGEACCASPKKIPLIIYRSLVPCGVLTPAEKYFGSERTDKSH